MKIEQILEILENYKLRIPPTVFYDLKADIVNFEEPTTKNNLGVDCISRQALLNTTVKKNSIWNKITDSEGNNLETIISNLPSVTPQEPRWIPVSEYLPVTNDEVLVTYIVNGNTKKRYVETANCFGGEWSSVNDEYRITNTKIEIIAWCEMPKPYKAETEDT